MRQLLKAVAPLMLCFLSTTACTEKRTVESLPIPAERMDCVYVANRPALPPEHSIDWSKVTTVLEASQEHDRFVATVRDRERRVAGYIVELEGRYFACSNDAQWLREREADLQR